jgi:ssDNA-binding Zn-finger/Zn-ribbon topoisomerase 1
MPFVANSGNGDKIVPAQAEQGTPYACPECDGELKVRSSHEREGSFVSAHFWHSGSGSGEGCSGESDEHKRMKSIAMSKASSRWPDADIRWEETVGDRRADVLVDFDEVDPRLGEGVAIECQHKNEQKDTIQVTNDFVNNRYSVLWLYEEQFSGKDVDLDAGDWEIWWVTEVPKKEQWTDYHGVVHWLRQDKPVSVDFEVPIPIIPDEVKHRWGLKRLWARGFKSRFDDGISMFLPCSRCGELVSYYVKCNHEERRGWHLTLMGIGESKCSNCGVRSKPTNNRFRLSTTDSDWESGSRSGQQSLTGTNNLKTDNRSLLPCPNCQNIVEFETKTKARAERSHPWADMKISPISECGECGEQIRLKSNNVRLVGKDFDSEPAVKSK